MVEFKNIHWHDLPLDFININFALGQVEIGFNIFNEIIKDYESYTITAKQVLAIDFENKSFSKITNDTEITNAKLEKISEKRHILKLVILLGESLPSITCKIDAEEIMIDRR
jgi:hypothetical protein